MSLKKVLVTLVLGSSSLAAAQPLDVRDHRQDNGYYNYEAPPAGDYSEGRMRGWRRPITLATGVSITSDYRDHRAERPLFIAVDSSARGFSKLRFDQTMGTTFIESIVVTLPNGTSRTYSVRQMLSARQQSFVVDLDQRQITGIYVYGSTWRRRGSFDVVGMRR